MPDGLRILEQPVDTASYRYYGDLVATYHAMATASPERRAQALAGVPCSPKDMLAYFLPVLPEHLSQAQLNALKELLTYTVKSLSQSSRSIKSRHFRKRPYLQLGLPLLVKSDEQKLREASSYPSGHSTRGWGTALLFTELFPQHQEAILSKGYEFGYNRVIGCYHYASDVQAGRLVASYSLARLHSDPEFMRLLELARREVAKKH